MVFWPIFRFDPERTLPSNAMRTGNVRFAEKSDVEDVLAIRDRNGLRQRLFMHNHHEAEEGRASELVTTRRIHNLGRRVISASCCEPITFGSWRSLKRRQRLLTALPPKRMTLGMPFREGSNAECEGYTYRVQNTVAATKPAVYPISDASTGISVPCAAP